MKALFLWFGRLFTVPMMKYFDRKVQEEAQRNVPTVEAIARDLGRND